MFTGPENRRKPPTLDMPFINAGRLAKAEEVKPPKPVAKIGDVTDGNSFEWRDTEPGYKVTTFKL